MLSLNPLLTVLLFLSIATTAASSSNEPFHWSALVTPHFDGNGEWNCSGAYIGKRFVITSGVCVQGFSKFRIRLGAYYADHRESNTTRLEFKYDRVIRTNIASKHDSSDNKVTIFVLDEDPALLLNAYIQPISLPPEPTLVQLNDALDTNSSVLVWVQNASGDLVQRSMNMNVLLFIDCVDARPEVNVHVELCAAGDSFDGKYLYLCPHIGFGPLLVSGTNKLMLIGMGIDNCIEDKPQTFIRINGYWKWINQLLSWSD